MSTRYTVASAALCAAAVLLPAPAGAQVSDTWQYQAMVYAYLPTIGGKTTFPQNPGAGGGVSVDADTILSNLKGVFMGSLEARKGRWGAFTDVMYMDVGDSKSGTRNFTIGGREIPADVQGSLDYNLKGWVWTLAGTYRAVADPGFTLDVLAGARMLDIDQRLGWQLSGNIGPIPLPGRGGASDIGATNWDAIVGVKGRLAFGGEHRWFVPYYLDVGTGDSDRTWQGMAGLGYSFHWGDIIAAWRYLDYKFKSGKNIEDLNFNGPGIAVAFRW